VKFDIWLFFKKSAEHVSFFIISRPFLLNVGNVSR